MKTEKVLEYQLSELVNDYYTNTNKRVKELRLITYLSLRNGKVKRSYRVKPVFGKTI